MNTMQAKIEVKMAQWDKEAAMAFAMEGQHGTKMERFRYVADGPVFVRPQGSKGTYAVVSLAQAIAIFKAGWKVIIPEQR